MGKVPWWLFKLNRIVLALIFFAWCGSAYLPSWAAELRSSSEAPIANYITYRW